MSENFAVPRVTIGGDLYRLLWDGFPQWRRPNGTLDTQQLANAMGFTREGCYKWLRSEKLPPGRAVQLIAASEGRLTEYDFVPFVFRV